MSKITKADVDKVRAARWEVWKRMAREASEYHILSIELLRTEADDTVAVFTVVKNKEPVQYVLRGDSLGSRVRAMISQQRPPLQGKRGRHVETELIAPMAARSDDGVSADSIALGEPPPKEPPPPGIMSLGTSIMTTAFDLGEVAASSPTPR